MAETVVILDTPGVGTWVVPRLVSSITVEIVGGGGGGGGDGVGNGPGGSGDDTVFDELGVDGGGGGVGGGASGRGGFGGVAPVGGIDGIRGNINRSNTASGGRSGARSVAGISTRGRGGTGQYQGSGSVGGSGGGGGAYFKKINYAVSEGDSINFVVGDGGAGGSGTTHGSKGISGVIRLSYLAPIIVDVGEELGAVDRVDTEVVGIIGIPETLGVSDEFSAVSSVVHEVDIPLRSGDFFTNYAGFFPGVGWLFPLADRVLLPSSLSSHEAYLSSIFFANSGTLFLQLARNNTEQESEAGPDFSSGVENNGLLTVQVGSIRIDFSLAGADADEPYFIQNIATRVSAFASSVRAFSGAKNGVFTVRDYSPSTNFIDSLSENFGVSDRLDASVSLSITLEEQLGLSDTEADVVEYRVVGDEAVGLSDTEAGIAEYHTSESEAAGLTDAADSELTDITRAIELSDFNTKDKVVYALGRITPGTFEGSGVFYRSPANNTGSTLGGLGSGSDMEVTPGQSVTQIAILSASAGTVRFWDNPSGSHWSTFFNDNPAAVLFMQFSLFGPAYPFAKGGQGGNFSNWSSTDTDVRAALAKVRDSGKIFLFAIAKPAPINVAEAAGLADTENNAAGHRVVSSDALGLADIEAGIAEYHVSEGEVAGLADAEAGVSEYHVNEGEAAGLSDTETDTAGYNIIESEAAGLADEIASRLTDIRRALSTDIVEAAGLTDAVASELTDTRRAVELSDFDTTNKTVHVLGRITPGTFENDGTLYRSSVNTGGSVLGDLGSGSDMEAASGMSVTRIAIPSASAGTIRFWDNPSTLHWFDFFSDNPEAVVLMQFSLIGPAYPFVKKGQGGNFSNWSSDNADARAALAQVRDDGNIFLFAIAEPTPLGIGEAVGLADMAAGQSSIQAAVADELRVLDSGQLGYGLVTALAEQLGLSDTEAGVAEYRVNEGEEAGLSDTVSDVAARALLTDVAEAAGLSDSVNSRLITPIDVTEIIGLSDAVIGEISLGLDIHFGDLLLVGDILLGGTATWPVSLPQRFNRSGFSMQLGKGYLEFSVTRSRPMRRKQFTKIFHPIAGRMTINSQQWEDLLDFYYNTLNAGETTFELPAPVGSGTVLVKFTKPPSRVARNGPDWIVDLKLRKM